MNLITTWGGCVGRREGKVKEKTGLERENNSKVRALGDGTLEKFASFRSKMLKIKNDQTEKCHSGHHTYL